jgi:hypothetical protein
MPELWVIGLFSALSRPGAELLGFLPVQRFRLGVLDAGPDQPNRFDLRREPR